jgi:cell division septation protein DedD
MATQEQIDANRINAQKSTGPRTPEGKANSRRNSLLHGLTAKTCMLDGEDPEELTGIHADLIDNHHPQDTQEDFLVERMAKARCRYNRIMPLEAAIFNIRLTVDQAPKEVVAALSQEGQRAWAYLRDANGGNALSKLSRYETALLREYDRSRQELEKLQKIRAARPTPPPVVEELRREPDPPVTPTKSAQPATSTPPPSTQNPAPAAAPSPEPDDELTIDDFQWIVDRR